MLAVEQALSNQSLERARDAEGSETVQRRLRHIAKPLYSLPDVEAKMKTWTIVACFGLWAAGCAGSNPAVADRTVEMFKPEQSLQCEPDSGVTEAELRTELAEMGITVLAYRRDTDGMVYPAVCGAPTGHVHVFTMEPGDVAAAEGRGYRKLRE